ncbi:Protein of unknown function, partial [Gryllus bimaculatus]
MTSPDIISALMNCQLRERKSSELANYVTASLTDEMLINGDNTCINDIHSVTRVGLSADSDKNGHEDSRLALGAPAGGRLGVSGPANKDRVPPDTTRSVGTPQAGAPARCAGAWATRWRAAGGPGPALAPDPGVIGELKSSSFLRPNRFKEASGRRTTAKENPVASVGLERQADLPFPDGGSAGRESEEWEGFVVGEAEASCEFHTLRRVDFAVALEGFYRRSSKAHTYRQSSTFSTASSQPPAAPAPPPLPSSSARRQRAASDGQLADSSDASPRPPAHRRSAVPKDKGHTSPGPARPARNRLHMQSDRTRPPAHACPPAEEHSSRRPGLRCAT